MSLLLAAGSPAVSASAHTAAYCSQCLNYSQALCTLWGHAAWVDLCGSFVFACTLSRTHIHVFAICNSVYTVVSECMKCDFLAYKEGVFCTCACTSVR